MRALLEQKKRRASQTPAWKTIVHHDHPAPRTDSVAGAPQAAGPAAPTGAVRPRGDRGGD